VSTFVRITDDAGQDIRIRLVAVTHLELVQYGELFTFHADNQRHDYRLHVYLDGGHDLELAYSTPQSRATQLARLSAEGKEER
jgi:hypothetical protein